MRTPSRRSTASSLWEMIPSFETGSFTKGRSPQFNPNNMSSGQVANASADGALAQLEADLNGANRTDTIAGYCPDHKAPSNSSTETPGTDDTATITGLPAPFAPAVAPLPSEPIRTHTPLTSSNMDLHQRELGYLYTGNIKQWTISAGIGSRFQTGGNDDNNNNNNDTLSSSLEHSLLTAPTAGGGPGGERSVSGSNISQGGDWVMVMPPSKTDEDVAGAGMWSTDMPMPPVMAAGVGQCRRLEGCSNGLGPWPGELDRGRP